MQVLGGRWDATLKGWSFEYGQKRQLLQALKGLNVEDKAQAPGTPYALCTS